MKRKKTLLLGILIVPIVAFAFQLALMGFAKAGYNYNETIHYIKGWIWGGDESSSGIPTGVGWGSVSGDNVSGGADYQVDVPFWDCGSDCNVTGYAWHENIGWIDFDFNPSGSYPRSPNHSVKRVGDNLTGWARITGIEEEMKDGNSGGWEGWIKMSGSSYGVDLSNPDDSYAWSDELGWIQFSDLDLPDVPQMKVCRETIKIALDESVGIDEEDDEEDSEQLDAIYAKTFLKYDNCDTARSFLSQGDASIKNSESNWSIVDSEFSEFVDLDDGKVTSKGIADTPTGEFFEVKAEHEGASDTSEVCIYDCSCAKSEYFADKETCDCGCDITAETRRAYGEDWEETAN